MKALNPHLPDSAHLEKEIYDNLLDDDISSAIASLPDDFKTVIILSDIEGFTYDEIADFVDVPSWYSQITDCTVHVKCFLPNSINMRVKKVTYNIYNYDN
ncbi:MAG: hypothetical protein MZV64_15680 [Ignavibacteriales bacterium]|nr:hypothetical protein [Ignavibacteriales bacterium]